MAEFYTYFRPTSFSNSGDGWYNNNYKPWNTSDSYDGKRSSYLQAGTRGKSDAAEMYWTTFANDTHNQAIFDVAGQPTQSGLFMSSPANAVVTQYKFCVEDRGESEALWGDAPTFKYTVSMQGVSWSDSVTPGESFTIRNFSWKTLRNSSYYNYDTIFNDTVTNCLNNSKITHHIKDNHGIASSRTKVEVVEIGILAKIQIPMRCNSVVNGSCSSTNYALTDYNTTKTFTIVPSTGYNAINPSYSCKIGSTGQLSSSTSGNNLIVTVSATQGIDFIVTLKPNTYTVVYNGNGNTDGSTTSSSHTYNADKNLTANGFTRSHTVTFNYNEYGVANTTSTVTHGFGGWATSSGGSKVYGNKESVKNLTSTNNGTVNLYAKWDLKSTTLPTPTRTGYTFNGWYTAASGGIKVGNGGAPYTPTSNTTLYAQWTPHYILFKYYANNGETTEFTTWKAMASDQWPYNHYDYTKSEKPETYKTRIGYTGTGNYGTTKTNEFGAVGGKVFNQDYDFQSYEDLCNKYGKNITDQKIEVSIYAEWTPNKYTVTYNGNDSTSGSIGNSNCTYDVDFNLPSSGFLREYEVTYNANGGSCSTSSDKVKHTLSYWNTRADNSGTRYSLNESVRNLTSTNGETVPLYAQWTLTQITLPTPTRSGYTFKGWYTAKSGGTKISDGGVLYTPTANIDLYAQWKEHKYNIKFDGNGADDGETTQMNDIPYDTSKKLNLNGFIRIGYTFLGWSDAATHTQARYGDGEEVRRLTKEDGKTITLYAIWRQNTYTITWKNSTGDGSSYTVSIKGGTRPNELNVPNATKAYEEKVDGYHYLSYHWEPEFEIVGRDITYTAVFDATKHSYFDPVTTEPQGNYMGYKTHQCKQCNWSYKDEYAWLITFKNGDYNENRQDEVIKVPPGQIPQWSQIPKKTSENTLVFSFDTDNPWAPPVVATPTTEPSDKGNISYTPQFKSSTRYYTVTFENDDGTIRDIQTLEYDQDIVPPEPLDIDDAQYDYTFEYWYAEDDESDIILYGEKGKVKRDGVVYMPHYSRIVKAYRLEWWNNAGEEPVLLYYQDNVPYGTVPEYPFKTLGIPKKESTNDRTFTFTGWDCILIDPVTGEEKEFFFDDNNPEAEEKEDLEPIRWPTKYIAHFRDDTRYYKIKWLNPSENPNKEWDLFYEEEIQYGDVPEFDITKSETLKELKHPRQGKDKIFNYIFIGWKTSINDEPIEGELPFQGEITYMAVYIKKYIEYSIKIYRFYGDDYLRDKENNPKPEEYIRHYGDKLYPNALLNDIIGHDFSHWSNNQNGTNELTKNEVLSIVVEDTAEYWAIYNKKEYQVRWLDYNRVQIGDYKTFKYKDNPLNPEPPEQKPQEPTRGHDDLYHYTFRTWSIWSGRATSDGRILGNVSYIANYDKHEHSWEETTYEFTDYGKKCTASRICNFKHNGHIEEHTQSKEVKTTPIILNGDDATCTDMGYTTYVANFRDSWNITNPQQSIRIKDIPAKGHDYAPADSLGKNIEKGEHYIYCRRCDYSRIEPHNWQPIEDAEITSYAACLIGGKRKYRCQTFGCEGYYYEYIEPNGHNFTEDRYVKAVKSTCTKPGNVAYKQCNDCLLFFSENAGEKAYGEKTNKSFLTPPLGHDYILNEKRPIKKADCETAGDEYRTCSRKCGEEGADITIIIPPRGHDWAWQSTTTPATCTQEGKEKHYCQNTRSDRVTDLYKQCEVQPKEVTIPKTPHQPVTVYGSKPTCTKDGLSDGTKCRICNTELTLQYTLPALGHKCVAKNVVPAENTLRREIIYGCIRKDCNYDYHIEYIK